MDLDASLLESEDILYFPDDDEIASLLSTTGKGEKQPDRYRDWPYALVFLLHLGGVAFVAFKYGSPVLDADNIGKGLHIERFNGLIAAALITAGLAFGISMSLILVLVAYPKAIIKMSIYFSLVISGIGLVIGIASVKMVVLVACSLNFICTLCYYYRVRPRIPFAAANLHTAATAIKANFGVAIFSLVVEIAAVLLTSMWALAAVGMLYHTSGCDKEMECDGEPNYAALFGLLLSLFWTSQVLTIIVHVTVAGTISTWWFAPEDAASCCSSGVTSSFCRATTYSFGSICFGSILVAFFKGLRTLVTSLRHDNDTDRDCGRCIAYCVVECIMRLFETCMDYFNQWAFVYVGIYGYAYVDAGKSVMELFRSRGWQVIITDDLVSNTLSLVSFVVALITGTLGLLLEKQFPSWFEIFEENSSDAAFIMCFIVSLVISSIVFGIISSAVYTVIVCFAEAPAEFNENHQDHSDDMKRAWMEVYPEYYRYY